MANPSSLSMQFGCHKPNCPTFRSNFALFEAALPSLCQQAAPIAEAASTSGHTGVELSTLTFKGAHGLVLPSLVAGVAADSRVFAIGSTFAMKW